MSALKTSMLLLLLAAFGASEDPSPKNCDGLNVTLHNNELHRLVGDWVLVWTVADHPFGRGLLQKVASSHVELRITEDNSTLMFLERNMFLNSSCTTFNINMSIPKSDPEHEHRLPLTAGTVEVDGVVSPSNETGHAAFFQHCDVCMGILFTDGPEGNWLMNYRREGSHQDVEDLKKHHDNHKKQAECFGFPHDQPFSYDGAADFCHKKSGPEPTAAAAS